MNIRITYPGGRIDVFDTGAYATSAPFDSKNMLTDFEIGPPYASAINVITTVGCILTMPIWVALFMA